ncbi:MAG TPA: tetratricopeptide repeat protein [Bryobacteraceae bacterium]|jgi:tetratricopeptide (TPR) repeat protein|nr:tetratricopeptide repeat protein [Bryobacteraceae bacterium]
MASFLSKLPRLVLPALLLAGTALAQVSQLEGVVKDENGQPLKDAVIRIDRKDIKGKYELKTKKKGDYLHAGLPLGTYKVTLVVNGQERDSVDNVKTRLGEPTVINFNMQETAAKQQAVQKAAETGTLTQEQARDMTPEQKAAIEKQMKERQSALAKNKELNDAFNAGMAARDQKNWQGAVDAFEKASTIDPKQSVIWGNMAEAYVELSKTKTGAEQQAALDKGTAAYAKALEIAPNDAAYHNNYALALARAKKFDLMEAELKKAVELDPTNAGRYYYNMGAVLVNSNQQEPACAAFEKAIAADPNYADAHYQRAMCLTAKAQVAADGKMTFPPGTEESFQKYLELKPDGQFADSAKGMLTAMGSKIETEYRNPNAKKPETPSRRPTKK